MRRKMIDRREFVKGMAAGAVLLGARGISMRASSTTPTQRALVMDAMAEIRTIYDEALVREILDSGTNSVTVTLCDPKTQEQEAYDATMDGILEYDRYLRANSHLFIKATKVSDVDKARAEGKMAIFYLTQNSTPVGRDLDRVDLFYGLGLRSMQLTYNHQNWVGAGCKERTDAGLTRFGLELIEKLNEARVLIDLSHANMPTMADAIKASKVPVVVSHTCCKALNHNPRNTTDENLRALADRGGVVGITQMRPFMTEEKKNAVKYYFQHIDHAIKVVGIDHVCIGSDRDHRIVSMTPEYIAELKAEEGDNFDDSHWPLYFEELNGPRRKEVVWDGIVKLGYSEDQVEKVMGKNLYRLYREVIG
jgi:membrane dipeptidase